MSMKCYSRMEIYKPNATSSYRGREWATHFSHLDDYLARLVYLTAAYSLAFYRNILTDTIF